MDTILCYLNLKDVDDDTKPAESKPPKDSPDTSKLHTNSYVSRLPIKAQVLYHRFFDGVLVAFSFVAVVIAFSMTFYFMIRFYLRFEKIDYWEFTLLFFVDNCLAVMFLWTH